jgi:hypothetical protein
VWDAHLHGSSAGTGSQGERVYGPVPRNRGKNTTLLASMGAGGMGPCLTVEGATTKVVFETYVEQVLAPALWPGQVVVMDNLGAHRGDRVREFVQERGCSLLSCRPTLRTSRPSRRPSRRSRRSFGRPQRALRRRWLRPSAWRSRRLRPRTRWAISDTAATCLLLNLHEKRCIPDPFITLLGFRPGFARQKRTSERTGLLPVSPSSANVARTRALRAGLEVPRGLRLKGQLRVQARLMPRH